MADRPDPREQLWLPTRWSPSPSRLAVDPLALRSSSASKVLGAETTSGSTTFVTRCHYSTAFHPEKWQSAIAQRATPDAAVFPADCPHRRANLPDHHRFQLRPSFLIPSSELPHNHVPDEAQQNNFFPQIIVFAMLLSVHMSLQKKKKKKGHGMTRYVLCRPPP